MGDDMGYPILKLPHRVLQIFWDIQLTLGYSGYWKIIKSQIRNLNKGKDYRTLKQSYHQPWDKSY